MGRLSGKDESSSSTTCPFRATLTWNSNTGSAWLNEPDRDGIEVESFSGIIVDPNWMTVTGQKRSSNKKVKSTLTKTPDVNEYLFAYYSYPEQTPRGVTFKHEKIAEGTWKKIKTEVENAGGQWTRSTIVLITKMVAKGGVATNPNQLVQFRTRGACSVESWSRALVAYADKNKTPSEDYRNLDGIFIHVGTFFRSEKNSDYLYPEILLSGGDPNSTGQKMVLAKAGAAYDSIQDYWAALIKARNGLESEVAIEQEFEKENDVLHVPIEDTKSTVFEDDLPF